MASTQHAKYMQSPGYHEGPAAEWWEICIQKAGQSTTKGTDTESFPFFSGPCLSLLRYSLLCSAILGRGKSKCYVLSMHFFLFMFILCDVNFQSNCVFDLHGKLLRWHNLYLTAHTCICILFLIRTAEMPHKSYSTVSISLLNVIWPLSLTN